MRAWAAEFAPDADADAETRKFVARARDRGKTSADWRAAWEDWMQKPYAAGDTRARASPPRRDHGPPATLNGRPVSARTARAIAALDAAKGLVP